MHDRLKDRQEVIKILQEEEKRQVGKKRVFSESEMREELQESRKRLKLLEEKTEKVRMIVAKGYEKETLAKMMGEYNLN